MLHTTTPGHARIMSRMDVGLLRGDAANQGDMLSAAIKTKLYKSAHGYFVSDI